VRPSGTEPKIKFYIEVKDATMKCAGCYERCSAAAVEKIEAIKKSLKLD
jgi:phosphoglucomutase